MARLKIYGRFLLHIIYIIFLSYLITQRSYKVTTVKKLERYLVDLKHILIWTKIHGIEQDGQSHLIEKRCKDHNCYFTKNRNLFGDVRYFDAIIFNAQDVSKSAHDLPQARSTDQKYIFAANDSADNYPVCSPLYDDFFNWTWSYKTDSTIVYKFISVYNIHDEELGTHFHWIPKMEPISKFMKNQLHTKYKAAAIFLDKCESRSQREEFIKRLQTQLSNFDLGIDVFGECGQRCKKKTMAACHYKLKRNYYFYLALEDSFSMDFITDDVINAYKNNLVPIVFGGADYDKYLPPGSYINAMSLTEADLAKKMNEAIKNREVYYEYFRWKNHYIMKSAPVLDACTLCEILNRPTWLIHKMSYTRFRQWWNPGYERLCNTKRYFIF